MKSDLVESRAVLRRRQWHPSPVLLPGKSHGRRSLVGCSPWGRKESGTTERLHVHFSLSCIGEGNGNPFQCACLKNPRDGEPVGLPSMGSHRVGHNWSDLAAAAEQWWRKELLWVDGKLSCLLCFYLQDESFKPWDCCSGWRGVTPEGWAPHDLWGAPLSSGSTPLQTCQAFQPYLSLFLKAPC